MTSIHKAVLAMICAALFAAAAPPPAKRPVYILEGYRFAGVLGPANTAGIIAKLKHQPGARITAADIAADVAIFAKELKARHLRGRFFTTTEEKRGRIWVTFGLWQPIYPHASAWSGRRLDSEHFEGAPWIAASAFLRAAPLKPGDTLAPEKLEATKDAIKTLLEKSGKGAKLTVGVRIQTEPNNKAIVTWIIGRPRALVARRVRNGTQTR